MPSRENVSDWIAWERENLAGQVGRYPLVTDVEVTGLWEQDASEHFSGDTKQMERTLDIFAAELIRDPTDATPRFVALHFYYLARAKAEVEIEADALELIDELPRGEADAQAEAIRAEYRRDAGLLIGLLPIERCPSDWNFIEWEILNSCLVGDLGRILKLLDKAEEQYLINRPRAQLFRAQYRFVAAMRGTAELESQAWRPRLCDHAAGDPQDRLQALRLLTMCMASRKAEPSIGRPQRELLTDAAHELSKAVTVIPEVPAPYRATLARSYFGIGKFREGAEEYHRLLNAKLRFGERLDLKKAVYEALALSHERAGDTAAARRVLSIEIQEYPQEKGLWMRMAELEAQEAQYEKAAEYVRREAELDPGVDRDWRLSALLALGETQKSLGALRKANPELYAGVRWGLERFWQPFPTLHSEAKKACAEGEFCMALSRRPEFCPEFFSRDAALHWAAAVEVELREKLFRRLQEFVGQSPELRSLAELGLGKDKKIKVLSEFLLRRRRMGLGEMQHVLRRFISACPEDGIFYELRRWLEQQHPAFDACDIVRKLDHIVSFRNATTHREGSAEVPEAVVGYCQAAMAKIANAF